MNQKTKIVVVACEGQHDIAFITRILHTSGFNTDNKKIKDFPSPFNVLFKKIAESMVLSDRKLGYQSPNFLLPSVALGKEDNLVLLHNLSGDGRVEERRKLLNSYSELIGEDDFTKDLNFDFRFLFFFDADQAGVPTRLSEISTELGLEPPLENGILISKGNCELGCYVYHENGHDTGVLEDILLDHFSNKDRGLIGSVTTFLTSNALEPERTKELHINDGVEAHKGKSKYHEKKSKVNLFGQLQFSGMNNSVVISKSDFLRKSDIETCPQCTLIKSMFN